MSGFRRPVVLVVPGQQCPARRTNSSSDPLVRVTQTFRAGRRGIREYCGRCHARAVSVTQSTNETGVPLTAWYYEPHNAPLSADSELIACPHWEPGKITMRKGCTACAATPSPSGFQS